MLEAHEDGNHKVIEYAMYVFMTTQVYFFLLELIEMRHDVEAYYSSVWNNVDIPIFFVSLIYFVIRIQNTKSNYYPYSHRPS